MVQGILVTGSSGLVGSHLCKYYLDTTSELVYGLDSRPHSALADSSRFSFIGHDIATNFDDTSLPEKLDIIIHLAADMDSKDLANLFAINTLGTLRFLEYGRRSGIRTFIFASTGGVYGYSNAPLRESSPVRPLNGYTISKYAAEQLVKYFSSFFSTVILRLFFPYGSGQRGRLIPSLVHHIGTGQPITIHPDDHPRINPVHVDDVVRAIVHATKLAGHYTLNIAGAEVFTIRQIAGIIGDKLGVQAEFVKQKDTDVIGDMVGDISLAKRTLDWQPKIALGHGLDALL